MKTVANLMALAIKTDVLQRFALVVAVKPIGEYPLIGFAKLAGPGEHAAAVDPHGEAKGIAIFEGKLLGGQLRASVERYGRRGGKRFVDAVGREADNIRTWRRMVCVVLDFDAEICQWQYRIDTTSAQQCKASLMAFAELEQVDRSD